MKNTLASQLFLRIMPILSLMLILILLLAFYSCRREVNYVYDIQMVNDANVLWNLVEDELNEKSVKSVRQTEHDKDSSETSIWDTEADNYGSARMFRIWHANILVMMSDTAMPRNLPQLKPGFTNMRYQGIEWRIYSKPILGTTITMEIGEKMALRNALTRNILIDLFLPLLVFVPLIGLGLWYGIRRGLGSMQTLVRQIYTRSPDDLSPIMTGDLPKDLMPFSKSINRLFEKLSKSISAERMFADHAAHQLRTPLAGSRLLIQMLSSADSAEERQVLIADLKESNLRASELVNKLLVAARVRHQPMTLQRVALYHVVARVIAEMGLLAAQKSLALSLDGSENAQVVADETLLALAVANVIENAVKYTPNEGNIAVSIIEEDKYWRLAVSDTGPGIPSSEHALVFQRFYRAEIAEGEGTGLGLAIVADIIERFSGAVRLSAPTDASGLLVEIRLPKP